MPGVMVQMQVYLHPSSKDSESSSCMMVVKMGLIPNALLMFKSGTKSGDYHQEINFDNYERWLKRS
jgi:hypothetical protein